jgi:hypothetical protein
MIYKGSVLGADTTFNFGDLLVTVTTYRHLLIENIKTGESTAMIGPVLLHQKKNKTIVFYFYFEL